MTLIQAAQLLFPGTSWNLSVDMNGNKTISQSIDGTPRVQVPTLAQLQAVIAADPDVILPDFQTQILMVLQGGPTATTLLSQINAYNAQVLKRQQASSSTGSAMP